MFWAISVAICCSIVRMSLVAERTLVMSMLSAILMFVSLGCGLQLFVIPAVAALPAVLYALVLVLVCECISRKLSLVLGQGLLGVVCGKGRGMRCMVTCFIDTTSLHDVVP